MRIGILALMAALLALLAGVGWFVYHGLAGAGTPMPVEGIIALAAGTVLSAIVGSGLMILVFYSSRHGYDEPAIRDDDDTGPDRP